MLISTLAASFGSFLLLGRTPNMVFMFVMKKECSRDGEKRGAEPGELHTFLKD